MLKLPTIMGSTKARNALGSILNDVERGATFIIKGPKKEGALVMSVEAFRKLQEAYLGMVGQLETMRLLEDERKVEEIERISRETAEVAKLRRLSEFEEREGSKEGHLFMDSAVLDSFLGSGLLDLSTKVQNHIMMRLRQIVEAPEEVGYPLGSEEPDLGPDLRAIHGPGYQIIWRVREHDGETVAVIVDVRIEKAAQEKDEDELHVSRSAIREFQELPVEAQQQVVHGLMVE